MRILFITPPFTQLNTPYPATAYLKGFCNTKAIDSFQCDLGIEVILEIFSKSGLTHLFRELTLRKDQYDLSPNLERIIRLQSIYINTIDDVIAFLQNRNSSLAYLICESDFLPEAGRFGQMEDLDWAFGTMGIRDKARHMATLYLEDLSDLIKETVDPNFGFSRYAERLGLSANSFDDLENALQQPPGFTDLFLTRLLKEKIDLYNPDLVCLSVPFPGNLFGALRCGQYIKKQYPTVKVQMGGGYPNTELRSVSDIRVFQYLDFISLDDGEITLLNLVDHLNGNRNTEQLKRTFTFDGSSVIFNNNSRDLDIAQRQTGTPDYSDLKLEKYLSVIEIANPMHRLWSDGRWNKLTLAHGCYWGKCSFCDITLNYIKEYEPLTAELLCDRIESIIAQTGDNGFHFVDEAAPPALLRALAIEILHRKLTIVWWTNIRFEKSFSADLCRLLKASGCIAVSGGLEVASDRILQLIEKGVSVAQVARVTNHFTHAGIMVHAYLMYGFPTQTEQETIDSLEVVRQLFMNGIVHSGFWHLFAMTAHSPIGKNPEVYGVKNLSTKSGTFANNDLIHQDPDGADHAVYRDGLKKALFNYMHGICFEYDLQEWFDFEIPTTTIAPDFIENILLFEQEPGIKPTAKAIWLGNQNPHYSEYEYEKKGKLIQRCRLVFHNPKEDFILKCPIPLGKWIANQITTNDSLDQWQASFEANGLGDFDVFVHGKTMEQLRENGLLLV